jgi:hypothetical protein
MSWPFLAFVLAMYTFCEIVSNNCSDQDAEAEVEGVEVEEVEVDEVDEVEVGCIEVEVGEVVIGTVDSVDAAVAADSDNTSRHA